MIPRDCRPPVEGEGWTEIRALEHEVVWAQSSAVALELQGEGEEAAALRLVAWSLLLRLERMGRPRRAAEPDHRLDQAA